jgi:DNA-binding CsgD family transcriptional regulator
VTQLENELKLNKDQLVITNEKRKSSIYFIALLSLGVIGLFFTLYRQNLINKAKKKIFESEKELSKLKEDKLVKDVENKNKEVTSFAIHVNEKKQTLLKIRKELTTLIKITPIETKKRVRQIISNIDNTINVNQERTILYSKIDEVNNAFFTSIANKYPKLTKRETEIAGYLRLNLSSKQIAIHFNIAEQSINNYRTNIRKKMNLDSTDDLTFVLKKI